MIRVWSIVLGIGLVILGISGFYNGPGGTWIAWLDFVGALLSFVAAASAVEEPRVIGPGEVSPYAADQAQRNSGPGILVIVCVGLFVLWIVGMVSGSVRGSIAWWNFAFGCAYGLLALSGFGRRRGPGALVEERHRGRAA